MPKKQFQLDIIDRIVDKSRNLSSKPNKKKTKKKLNQKKETNSNNTNKNITKKNLTSKEYIKKEKITKIQRAYYIEEPLLNDLEDFCDKKQVEKSNIVNDAIRLFLEIYK